MAIIITETERHDAALLALAQEFGAERVYRAAVEWLLDLEDPDDVLGWVNLGRSIPARDLKPEAVPAAVEGMVRYVTDELYRTLTSIHFKDGLKKRLREEQAAAEQKAAVEASPKQDESEAF